MKALMKTAMLMGGRAYLRSRPDLGANHPHNKYVVDHNKRVHYNNRAILDHYHNRSGAPGGAEGDDEMHRRLSKDPQYAKNEKFLGDFYLSGRDSQFEEDI